MTVWVTGASGMLGQEVVQDLHANVRGSVIATDREVDITSHDAVSGFMSEQEPFDWIVNCAAWTAGDDAETNREAATLLNTTGPQVLAEAAQECGAALVHLSTDYVFAGSANRPYMPDDPASPQSVYGRTKYDGEEAVRSTLARHIIIRTAWLYGPGGKNFVSTMLRLMNEREEIGVVADQFGLPTYASDLAGAIKTILIFNRDKISWGTYHYTNSPASGEQTTGINWFQFAQAIYELGRAHGFGNSECRIKPLTTADYPTAAQRPAYSVLDCDSIMSAFAVTRPDWRSSLERDLAQRER